MRIFIQVSNNGETVNHVLNLEGAASDYEPDYLLELKTNISEAFARTDDVEVEDISVLSELDLMIA